MNQEAQPHILYVEDDPASATLVRRLLEAEGFKVNLVEDGMAAVDVAQQIIPDLILMDINIGGMDGYEVTTRLRAIDEMEDVPIVAVTAATLRGDRERALIAGCAGYIPKPIDVDKFSDQVRAFLRGRREELESPEQKVRYLSEYSQRLVKRLEEKIRELEKAHSELQRIEKVKSDFILLASHELRTPLTSIYGYVQMLLQDSQVPGDPEEEGSPRHLLQRIADASKRLSQVFDEIRNVSLIDADRLSLASDPVILGKLIQNVVKNLENFGPSRALQFELKGLDEMPMICGDSRRLYQALWNVISNAMKYTPDGGRITISSNCIEDTVHISVRDTGVGIPPELQDKIFDRFYVLEDTRYHRSSKTAFKGGGMGLGLPVAQGIIEAHGGKAWVESEGYDEERLPGSTFHILLPLELATDDEG